MLMDPLCGGRDGASMPGSRIPRSLRGKLGGAVLAPRLELRRHSATELTLSLFGAENRFYRIQESPDLETWREVGALTGPEGEMTVRLEAGASARTRFFRALWP